MNLRLRTAPAEEPVSLAETKLHLRVDTDYDDTLIQGLITAARISAETFSHRALVAQIWDLVMDCFPGSDTIKLPRPPLISTTLLPVTITYKLLSGEERIYPAASYVVDTASEPGRLRLVSTASWPGDELYPLSAVTIRYSAGYGDAVAVPQIYKQAILLYVGHWYENRETVVSSGSPPQELPMGAESLLWQDRISAV